jgi:mitochondrial fission protein ELM1
MPGTERPLTLWAVSDGRVGIEAQVLGLAEAVARRRSAAVIVKRVAWKGGVGRLPSALNFAPRLMLTADSAIAPPWPDLWIAAGRATLPLSVRMRRWSRGATFVVQTQHPRTSPARFDFVVPPLHDRLDGDNVLPIVGSPSRLTPDQLAAALGRFSGRLEGLPRPRVTAAIGGKSGAYDLTEARAAGLAQQIGRAVSDVGGSLLLTFTRRTPAPARRIMTERLSSLPGWIWDDTGDNPYFAFMAAADHVLVTEDSVNLAVDAAATGRPVHILAMDRAGGQERKFRNFHDDLQRRGIARPFTNLSETWSYPPLAEADRAARELLRLYDLHLAAQAAP